MLSRENQNQLSEEQLAAAFSEASRAARKFAQSMVIGHNPDPHAECNAPNPAHDIVHIRLIRPAPVAVWVSDADAVKNHNSFVGSLGRTGTRFGQ